MTEMRGEILVARTDIEGELRIVEIQIVVGEIDGERQRKSVDVDIKVGENAVAQRRHIVVAVGAVEIGIVGADGAGDNQRVMLGYLGYVLCLDRHSGH